MSVPMLAARRREWEAEQERLDYRAALAPMLLANHWRDEKKRPKPFTVEDFMIFRKPKPPQTVKEQLIIAESLNAVFGGADLRQQSIGATDEEKQAVIARLKRGGG